mgnify:FL=1
MTSVLDKKKGLDFQNALLHLSKEDRILNKVIKEIKPKEPDKRKPNFEALVRIISGQQLSSAAASTIFSRLKHLFENKEITPSQIKKTESEAILKCGLSKAKTRYIHNLAEFFLEKPEFINELKAKDSDELIESLKKIKGIGIWSASIFALFYLNHPDVFAWGDVTIKKAIRLLYEEENIDDQKINKITYKWKPYRSTACLVLWRWVDEGAVKFS